MGDSSCQMLHTPAWFVHCRASWKPVKSSVRLPGARSSTLSTWLCHSSCYCGSQGGEPVGWLDPFQCLLVTQVQPRLYLPSLLPLPSCSRLVAQAGTWLLHGFKGIVPALSSESPTGTYSKPGEFATSLCSCCLQQQARCPPVAPCLPQGRISNSPGGKPPRAVGR